VSYSHDDGDIDHTVEAISRAARVYAKAIDARSTDGLLIGAPSRSVYRRFN
jgi:glutamate-1-semialdehyde 2,1-aminomutase